MILSQYLGGLSKVKDLHINLSQNEFSDTAVKMLLNSLQALPLTKLQLKLNQVPTLSYFTIEHIQQYIQHILPTINVLNLEINSIKFGMRGTQFLTQAFQSKHSTNTVDVVELVDEEYEVQEEFDEIYEVEEDIEDVQEEE